MKPQHHFYMVQVYGFILLIYCLLGKAASALKSDQNRQHFDQSPADILFVQNTLLNIWVFCVFNSLFDTLCFCLYVYMNLLSTRQCCSHFSQKWTFNPFCDRFDLFMTVKTVGK